VGRDAYVDLLDKKGAEIVPVQPRLSEGRPSLVVRDAAPQLQSEGEVLRVKLGPYETAVLAPVN